MRERLDPGRPGVSSYTRWLEAVAHPRGREIELRRELDLLGLYLRDDSGLCRSFIDGDCSIEAPQVARIMLACDRRFKGDADLDDYLAIVGNPGSFNFEPRRELRIDKAIELFQSDAARRNRDAARDLRELRSA